MKVSHKPLRFLHSRLPRHILQLVHRKRRAWQLARSVPSDVNRRRFKWWSSLLCNSIKAFRRDQDNAALSGVSAKNFYREVSKRLNPPKDSFPLLSADGLPLCTDKDKADAFNDAFVHNFANLPYVRPVPIFTQGFDVNITRDVVATHMRKLSNSAESPDVISNVFLRLAAPGLISPLTTIFQRSMFEAKIPDAWRVAKVLPLYKGKGTRGDPNTYRPISITSSVCKLLESIVKGQASGHLHATRPLSPTQHGFQPKKSTVTNLLCAENFILNGINNDMPVDVFLLDFSRAFDKVPHHLLIDSLSTFGFSYRLISWFANLLCNRRQFVSVNDSQSAHKPVTSGVIQGSVLGPFLFSLFIDSLPAVVSYCKFLLFADDSKLMGYVVDGSYQRIAHDLQEVVAWSERHCLPLNIDKCVVIHYDGRSARNPCHDYYIKGVKLASTNACADLGITRTSDGRYRQHIASVCSKASRRVGLALRVFQCRESDFMLRLFTSYIRPLLEYAVPIWSPTDVGSSDLLERIQRRFTKRIRGFYHLSYEERLSRLNLPLLKHRRDFLLGCLVYKLVHNILAVPLHEVGLQLSTTHTRTGGLKLLVPRPLCTTFHNCVIFRAVMFWNSLPYNIINCTSFTSFRYALYNHICQVRDN